MHGKSIKAVPYSTVSIGFGADLRLGSQPTGDSVIHPAVH